MAVLTVNWYAAAAAVYVWSCRPLHTLLRIHIGPSALLMVHAMLTLAVKVWLCGMTHTQADPQSFSNKIQPKTVSLYVSVCNTFNLFRMQTSNHTCERRLWNATTLFQL